MPLSLAEESFISEHLGIVGMKEMATIFAIAVFVNREPQDIYYLVTHKKNEIEKYLWRTE